MNPQAGYTCLGHVAVVGYDNELDIHCYRYDFKSVMFASLLTNAQDF